MTYLSHFFRDEGFDLTIHSTVHSPLRNNYFTGTLPESIGNWDPIGVAFSGNPFTGTIPNSIGNWTNVMGAAFHKCNFTGTVPEGLCLAPNIHVYGLHADCISEVQCDCCDWCY